MLGDKVESALCYVGVTQERVELWLGKPCNCPERKEKLNQLVRWASRVVAGNVNNALVYLEGLLHETR